MGVGVLDADADEGRMADSGRPPPPPPPLLGCSSSCVVAAPTPGVAFSGAPADATVCGPVDRIRFSFRYSSFPQCERSLLLNKFYGLGPSKLFPLKIDIYVLVSTDQKYRLWRSVAAVAEPAGLVAAVAVAAAGAAAAAAAAAVAVVAAVAVEAAAAAAAAEAEAAAAPGRSWSCRRPGSGRG